VRLLLPVRHLASSRSHTQAAFGYRKRAGGADFEAPTGAVHRAVNFFMTAWNNGCLSGAVMMLLGEVERELMIRMLRKAAEVTGRTA
jgi:hypothetical protein